jgi:uncharacterized protein YfaS (alpha-2-macroglobulin family)
MDVMDPEVLNKILEATFNGRKMDISWTSEAGNHQHSFRIAGIQRGNSPGNLRLAWDGKPVKVDLSGELDIPVPATDFFGKLSERIDAGAERSLIIYFSDPLDPGQDIRGLVSTGKESLVSYLIQANILKVFFSEAFDDELRLTVHPGLMNAAGKKLGQGFEITEPAGTFASLKPRIKAVSTGNILPTSQGLIFPFEAVNVKAVRLTVIKIFESNIGQFLQENRLDGYYQMKRVGRPVFSKTIPLTQSGVSDFTRWNRFTLDLTRFIQVDPGAIYQVNISFNKNMILYPCGKPQEEAGELTDQDELEKLNRKFEGPEGYYYSDMDEDYYSGDYDWNQRDNPCNPAYYSFDMMIHQNLIATDIGLILKRGSSGDVVIAVSDIRTAKPLAGADLEILDYQLQQMTTAKSDADGFASFRLGRKPFLLIARYGKQRSYLRIDDGSALSLSNFDVSGEEVQKGLKGYIYGERGVWRPGDTLFLSFILEDRQQVLPPGHPIVFELKNPQGQLVTKLVKPYGSETGIYSFITSTSPDAPTGKWTALVKTGGTTFTKVLRIETVKPNRLKINFQFNRNVPFGKSGRIEATLHSQWLTGVVAGNLKATYEVLLTKARAEFKSWKNYVFDDPGVTFWSETLPVFDGRLDARGDAKISTDLKLNMALPSALNGYFRGKVFEPGGDFSVDFLTEPILPYSRYVGMRAEEPKEGRWLEADREHTVSLATIDRNGQPVSLGNLKAEIYKVSWSWWWEEEDAGNAEYVVSSYQKPIFTTDASTVDGKGSFRFLIRYPDWGRFYIRVINPETGQSCGQFVYVDWPDSYGRSDANIPGGATMLPLSADRSKCNIGETVRVTIPGMPGARALISLENGSKVLKAYWIDAGKNENVEEIRAVPEMAPNVFIHVSVIQPHKDKKNDLPIRQYGILSLEVEDPGTYLTPEIRMADILKPEQDVGITVSEKSGKPMTYTIAVVDEGLLDLTRFKTPDPHQAFFANEALGVRTFDLYDQVIGAFGGTLERLLSIGGDEGLKQEDQGKKIRFKPVVKFLGPFVLEKGKKAIHTFRMPNYVGSVRTMVVACGNGAYGMAEKTTPVKQDVMVLATLPRVLSPGEEVRMPVNVFCMSPAVKSVQVTVKSSPILALQGPSSQTVAFSGEGDKIIYFRFKAASSTGNAHVEIMASGNGNRSTFTIDLPVRSPNIPVRKVSDHMLNPGQEKAISFTPFGLSGTCSALAELSGIEKINFTDRIRFLVQYPYGCAEQTTSAVFAQLYLPKVVDLSGDMLRQTEDNIRAAVVRLGRIQAPDGGFAYWPGSRSIDDWTSSWAGHFLLEAMKTGYSVPDHIIGKWKEYQQSAARRWIPDPKFPQAQLIQAYRLYTLALAGYPEMGPMNRLKEEPGLTFQASWRLAAAYALAGKRETAQKMIASLPLQFREYREQSFTYGSGLRDQAMVLETLTELSRQDLAATAAKPVAAAVNGKSWLSTQESAFSLMALAKYYMKFERSNGVNALVNMNGQETRCETNRFFLSLPLKIAEGKNNRLVITNRSTGVLFVTLEESGIPLESEDMAFRRDLNMTVSFTDKEGRPIDVTRLTLGTEIKISVRVRSADILNGCRNLALTQVFPSGWEISNTRIGEEGSGPENPLFNYQDFRDDRVNTFFDLYSDKEKVFVFTATAAYAGRFYLPGTYCEAMYDNRINAKDKGMWIEVVQE